MFLIIGVTGILMAGGGFVGHLFFLSRSFSVVGVEMNPEEKAATLAWTIRAAMISNVAVLLGVVVAVVGPLAYWLVTGGGDPWE